MLTIEKSKRYQGKCTPNVLPCRINHNGAVNASKRYWNPLKIADGKTVSYFRGRKLYGKQLKVPKGYRGIVVSSTDRILPKEPLALDGDGVDEAEEVKVMEQQSDFEDIMIWGHEVVLDGAVDPYVRGVEEWIGFAEQIHSYEDEQVEKNNTK